MDLIPAGYVAVRRLLGRRTIIEAIESAPPFRRVAIALPAAPRLDPDDPACPPGFDAGAELRRTAAVLARLDHPGIVRLVADHSAAAAPALVMAWTSGAPIDDAAVAALSPADRLAVACAAAEIVAHAHARGVILWDLKPGNLLLRRAPDPEIVLVDLDLACVGRATAGGPAGSWRWTSPEQAVLPAPEIDERADLFALGTVIHYLFAGSPAFSGGRAAIREQLTGARIAAAVAEVPPALGAMVGALLDPDRSRRPAASAVVAALRRLTDGEPVVLTGAGAATPFAAYPAGELAGRLPPTIAEAQAAVAAAPEDPARLLALAAVKSSHGEVHAVRTMLDRAARLLSDDAGDPTWLRAIELEVSSGRPDAALALCRRTRSPAHLARLAELLHSALFQLAYGWRWHERVVRALRHPELGDPAQLVLVLARTLLLQGRAGDATAAPRLERCIAWLRTAGAEISSAPRDDPPGLAGADVARPARSTTQADSLRGERGDNAAAQGLALHLLVRLASDPGDGLARLAVALREGELSRDAAPVFYRLPLADVFERTAEQAPAAARFAEALLLLHLDLGDEADRVGPLEAMDAARRAILRGRPGDALGLVPARGELALRIRALAQLEAGGPGPAVRLLAAAHAERPTWETAWWLCRSLVATGRAMECLPIIDAVWAELGPDAILGEWHIHGLVASQRFAEAAAAVRAAPDARHLRRALGAALDALLARPGLARRPEAAAISEALEAAGRAALHRPFLHAVWQAAPGPAAFERLLAACRADGDRADALQIARSELAARPSPAAALAVAEELDATGDLAGASQLVGEWIERTTDHAGLWCAAARIAAAEAAWPAVQRAAEVALALAPTDVSARLALATARLALGDARGALALAQLVLATHPASETAWLIALDATAIGAEPDTDAERSALVRAAATACPDSTTLRLRLVGALAARGDSEVALREAEAAVLRAPRDLRTWSTAARVLLDAGRAAEALAVARSAEAALGSSPVTAEIRLWAWLSLARYHRAIQAGLEVVAADAQRASTWHGLGLAWIASRAFDDARRAAQVLDRDGAPRAAARLAMLTAFASGDLDGALVLAGRVAATEAGAAGDAGAAFLRAVLLLVTGAVDGAIGVLRDLGAGAADWAPDLGLRIAIASSPASAAIAVALDRHASAAPREFGWAGARWQIARGQTTEAAVWLARATGDPAPAATLAGWLRRGDSR